MKTTQNQHAPGISKKNLTIMSQIISKIALRIDILVGQNSKYAPPQEIMASRKSSPPGVNALFKKKKKKHFFQMYNVL